MFSTFEHKTQDHIWSLGFTHSNADVQEAPVETSLWAIWVFTATLMSKIQNMSVGELPGLKVRL